MKIRMNSEELANMRATAISVATANGYEKVAENINDPVSEENRIGYLLIGDDLEVGIKEDALCDILDAIFGILNGYQEEIQDLIASAVGIVRAFDPIGFYKKFLAK